MLTSSFSSDEILRCERVKNILHYFESLHAIIELNSQLTLDPTEKNDPEVNQFLNFLDKNDRKEDRQNVLNKAHVAGIVFSEQVSLLRQQLNEELAKNKGSVLSSKIEELQNQIINQSKLFEITELVKSTIIPTLVKNPGSRKEIQEVQNQLEETYSYFHLCVKVKQVSKQDELNSLHIDQAASNDYLKKSFFPRIAIYEKLKAELDSTKTHKSVIISDLYKDLNAIEKNTAYETDKEELDDMRNVILDAWAKAKLQAKSNKLFGSQSNLATKLEKILTEEFKVGKIQLKDRLENPHTYEWEFKQSTKKYY